MSLRTLLVVTLLATAQHDVSTSPATLALPAPEGPHAVGFWETSITSVRAEQLTPDANDRRELPLQIWYPARERGETRPYVSAAMAGALTTLGLPAGLDLVRTHSTVGASRVGGKLPLVLMSHGLSWPGVLYQSFAEDLASRGYIVAVVTHPHGAAGAEFPDGRLVDMAQWPAIHDEKERDAFLASYADVWEADLRDALDACERWARGDGGGPVAGAVDMARVAVFGHSYGGTAAARVLDDRRVRGGIALEGMARRSDGAKQALPKPFLHVIGGYNQLELEGTSYEPDAGAPFFELIVNGAWHAQFSDFVFLYAPGADNAWRQRHRFELEPRRVIAITRDYAAAFLGWVFEGESHRLLRPVSYRDRAAGPTSSGYTEVELKVHIR